MKSRRVWETIICGKEEAKRRERVRKRGSYLLFMKLAKLFSEGRLKELLTLVYEEIDRRHGWGSCTNSQYAQESLTLLLQDLEESKDEKERAREI